MDQIDFTLLQTVPFYHLQTVAKVRHITFAAPNSHSPSSIEFASSSPSPTILQDIAQHLFEVSAIAAVLQELDVFEARLLRELITCGGRANSRDLAFYLDSAGLADTEERPGISDQAQTPVEPALVGSSTIPSLYPHYPEAHPHGIFERAVYHLLVLGLVFWGKQTHFVGRDYASGVHDGVLIVPQAVMAGAYNVWHLEENHSAEGGQTPVVPVINEHARAFQRSLYLYWSLVASAHEGFSLVNNGLLTRTSLRQISEKMRVHTTGADVIRLESDVPFLLFIRLLLMQLGLLVVRKNALYTEPAENFFMLPLAERVRRCYSAYRDAAFWNELMHLSEINLRPAPDPLTPAPEEVRKARTLVIERLLLEQKDDWHNLSAFIARTKLHIPYLLFPRQYGPRGERYTQGSNPYGWDFRLRRGWLPHREGWHMVEGGFIRSLLIEPLCWLGLVTIAQHDGVMTFSLSTDAFTLMQDMPFENLETPVGRLLVQPNFELVALAPINEGLLVLLDGFAERVSLEHIAQYRLTKASVTRAIQQGLQSATILSRLMQATEGEIPQNVRYSLEEWERQARRVEIWPDVTLLEVESSALLDELFADDAVQSLFRRRLTPLMAEVYTHKLAAMQTLLWQHDYLPALSVASDNDIITDVPSGLCEPQWKLHADGLLEPFYPVLDLYIVTQAILFCAYDDATGWLRVTEESLSAGLKRAIPLSHVVRFLQSYCVEGIPGSFLIRLKLWGSGYTEIQQIAVESSPLLRLSTEILQDLQADEEVAPLLGAEITAEQRLIHVDEKDLALVLTLLRKRGFVAE